MWIITSLLFFEPFFLYVWLYFSKANFSLISLALFHIWLNVSESNLLIPLWVKHAQNFVEIISSVEYYCQHLLTDLVARTSWSMLHLMWLMQLLYSWDCNLYSILLCFGCFWRLVVLVLSVLHHFILVNVRLQLYMFVYHGMGFLLLPAPSIFIGLAFYFGFKAQLDSHTSESLIFFPQNVIII